MKSKIAAGALPVAARRPAGRQCAAGIANHGIRQGDNVSSECALINVRNFAAQCIEMTTHAIADKFFGRLGDGFISRLLIGFLPTPRQGAFPRPAGYVPA